MHPPEDDLMPSSTPGYKPTAAKTAEEYANLDAEDESLARWKASLGIVPGATVSNTSGPKLTVVSLELHSETLPKGMTLAFTHEDIIQKRRMSFVIKEGVLYNVRIKFKVNHTIISGLRYIQAVNRLGVRVVRMEEMLGSYGPHPNAYIKNFDPETSPSGIIARSGQFNVRSRLIDDDGELHADWEWHLSIAKEWETGL